MQVTSPAWREAPRRAVGRAVRASAGTPGADGAASSQPQVRTDVRSTAREESIDPSHAALQKTLLRDRKDESQPGRKCLQIISMTERTNSL